MTRIGTFGRVNARIRAMRSEFLEVPVFRELAAAGTPPDFLRRLEQTAYGKSLEAGSVKGAAAFEAALIRDHIGRIRRIERQAPESLTTLLQVYLERFDVEFIKLALRCWFRKCRPEADLPVETFVFDLSSAEMLNAKTLNEWAESLKGTPYFLPVMESAAEFERSGATFPVELALDRARIDRWWEELEKLAKPDRRIALRIAGLEVDLQNLQWIARYRLYYGLAASRISELLIPHGYRLDSKLLNRAVSGEGLEDILRDLAPGAAFPLPEKQETGSPSRERDTRMLELLETVLYSMQMEEARRAFREFPFSIGTTIGFLTRLELERRNLITLYQARDYGLGAEAAEGLLIF